MYRDRMEKISELDKLYSDVINYKNSINYRALIEFIKKFPRIAPYNAMLIYHQRPGSSYVLPADIWQKKYDRRIKDGANPLVILKTFGPIEFVFDISDTEPNGKNIIPVEIERPFKNEGCMPEIYFNNLFENLNKIGVGYYFQDMGSNLAGYIRIANEGRWLKYNTKQMEYILRIFVLIALNSKHNREEQFATMVHELGHYFCGHLGTPNEKFLKDRINLSKEVKEFEAESVCWLVCERIGIHNPSEEYLNGYLTENKTIPDVSVDNILKAVGIIENLIYKPQQPRKELILSKKKIE